MRPPFARVRSTWARMIHKVYEVDSLECAKCKGPMRAISLIENSDVIRRILQHLGLWAPHQTSPRTHGPSAPELPGSSLNALTYHPVPEIA